MPAYELSAPYTPKGDQPTAIAKLVEGVNAGKRYQTLLGATGTGKTFTMANVIAQTGRPALVLAHNKTLAAQLCNELREFFPHNAVEYFISYYDYYQPEAYVPVSDTYIAKTAKADFVSGKQIFLQGCPTLADKNGIALGRLSGIVAHYVPSYLQQSRMPSWETNCIEDWEEKVEAIVEETLPEKMTLIAGIPSWVQMYFEKIKAQKGKNVGDVFPDFSLFVYGGVNFEPYRPVFQKLIGRAVDTVELFPASEGFFAYQDQPKQEGLLLLLNNDIFYEFIPVAKFGTDEEVRYSLEEVQMGENYVLILSTSAGLWGYNIGDTVRFVSLSPYRLVVTGRVKHFISAFGEHVIGKEVETAMKQAIENTNIRIKEFTVAPQISPAEGLPYHEWLVEFENQPENLEAFAHALDQVMQQQNVYYYDLIQGKVLRPLVVSPVKEKGFQDYMKSIGKLGGQNKVPRLSNDRKIADALSAIE